MDESMNNERIVLFCTGDSEGQLGGKESQRECEALNRGSIEGDAEKWMAESSENPKRPEREVPQE